MALTFRITYEASYTMVGRGKGQLKGGALSGWLEYTVDMTREEVEALTPEDLGDAVVDYFSTQVKFKDRHYGRVDTKIDFK